MIKKAKVYGSSLYDLAYEEILTTVIFENLQKFNSAFLQIEGYSKLLSSAAISKEERKKLVKEIWEKELHRYTLNFLYLLIDCDLILAFSYCFLEYENRYNKDNNILAVNAVFATMPTEEALKKLSAAILKKTGKTPKITVRVDESLIGGMRLEMEGNSYDSSIRYHMDALQKILQENM